MFVSTGVNIRVGLCRMVKNLVLKFTLWIEEPVKVCWTTDNNSPRRLDTVLSGQTDRQDAFTDILSSTDSVFADDSRL